MNRGLAREVVRFVWSSSVCWPSDSSRLGRFTSADWRESLNWLHLSGLALLFWNCLKRCGAQSQLPAVVGERLARNEADNRLRLAEMLREFDCINRLIERSGQPYAVLKGFALIPDYFPDAALRTFTDYDYLLPDRSVERIGQALKHEGYVRQGQDESYSVTYFRQDLPPRLVSNLDEIYSPRLGREIELHWRVWDDNKMGVRLELPGDFLSRCNVRTWEGLRFPVPAEDDAIIYQALHTFRHIVEGWCRLCAIYEIAYFLKQRGSDAGLWDRVGARLQSQRRLAQVVGVILSVAARVFNVTIPSRLNSAITGALSPGMALWVKRYGGDSALENFSVGKNGLFLYREFIENETAWRQVRRRQLFLLKWPNRVSKVSAPLSPAWKAAGRRLAYIAGLVRVQLMGSLRYGCELARWRRALRSERTHRRHSSENLQCFASGLDARGPVDNQR